MISWVRVKHCVLRSHRCHRPAELGLHVFACGRAHRGLNRIAPANVYVHVPLFVHCNAVHHQFLPARHERSARLCRRRPARHQHRLLQRHLCVRSGTETAVAVAHVVQPELHVRASHTARALRGKQRLPMVASIQHREFTEAKADADKATIVESCDYLDPSGKRFLTEERRLTFRVISEMRAIDVDQTFIATDGEVRFAPSEAMDYELELAIWIAGENKLGTPVTMAEAPQRIFGFGLLNDWSARDIQRWEMPPLGPFLAKSVSTSVSPWVITAEALEPFAQAAPAIDPPPLPYLDSAWNRAAGALGVRMQALLVTTKMRADGAAPALLTDTDFARMYWTAAQMVAHHGTNGCNMLPGDLLGSGTVSGPEDTAAACLAELGLTGPITLPNGETRRWLQDGDEVIFRARAEAPGAVSIGFGECRGAIAPAIAWPV